MKKWIYIILGVIVITVIIKICFTTPQKIQLSTKKIVPTTSTSHQLSRSIFIPYWGSSVGKEEILYDTYYYFGIVPNINGKIQNEVGLQNTSLVGVIPEKQKKLVLRMLDNTINETILNDQTIQNTLIAETKQILSQNAFSGLILDIEVPFTLQPNKKSQITKFVQLICTAMKSDYKTCSMLIYGDFSYRNRPYDLEALGEISDKILLMAYDFHKAGGEPGPNFPFDEKQKYGYDFKTMIHDALLFIPKEKIEVVFGMYGYDWTLNEQGTPLKSASALSLHNIDELISNFPLREVASNTAKEKNIRYIDLEGKKHILWYEDEESAKVKTMYLLEQGIWQVSFWASSYF